MAFDITKPSITDTDFAVSFASIRENVRAIIDSEVAFKTALAISNSSNSVYQRFVHVGTKEWRLGMQGSSNFILRDDTLGFDRLTIDTSGNIFAAANTELTERVFELRQSDYATTFAATVLKIHGSSIAGDYIVGVPNADLSVLLGQNVSVAIGTNGGGNIIFFTSSAERARFTTTGFKIGASGTDISRYLSVTSASLTFGSAAASGGTVTQTVTVTGAAVGDMVTVNPNFALQNGINYRAHISAADTVTIACINSTLGAITPTAGTWRVSVIKH